MPKLGPGKRSRGGGRGVASTFNALADPTASDAYNATMDRSSAFDSDAFTPRSSTSGAGVNPWSGK